MHYTGLTRQQVIESRQKHGENRLSPPPRIPWWKQLLGKFNDPIIKLLLVATLLSLVSGYFHGSYIESIGIFLAVLLATLIAFFNEYRAAKEFDLLNQVGEQNKIKVYRDDSTIEVPKTELVVGDIVILDQGDEVPADGRLLEAMTLHINESCLNGESLPAQKRTEVLEVYAGAYPPNRVYKGTTVTDGQGVMEVTEVGDATELGHTARQASEINTEQTPLNKQLGRLSVWIGRIGITMAVLVFTVLLTRSILIHDIDFTEGWEAFNTILHFFMVAVTLIVVAVPEGLAMSVTLCLAYSMRRMMANNTLVRKMHACETMGATTVICTDKTGTLTQNRMKVQGSYFPCLVKEQLSYNRNSLLITESIATNTTAHLDLSQPGGPQTIGNPTEGALLLWLQEKGVAYQMLREEAELLQRMVFSTERKFMASEVFSPALRSRVVYLKGAPEVVLRKCGFIQQSETRQAIAPFTDKLQAEVLAYQGRGMRTLALAFRQSEAEESVRPIEEMMDDDGFTYLGFVAIADPIRREVPPAMQTCMQAGLQVKIITGDVSDTAREIARQAGLWRGDEGEDALITGAAFSALSEKEALIVSRKLKVMSRARPADKLRLVRLLQQQEYVVAVTGDGTNDAPALNYANVGLAMGSGTSVAKEAGDIILLDDSFASIVHALRWGRSIYQNIQRFIQFQLTINVVALVLAFIGPLIGINLPLTITQMLWVNLIMDTFAALALASEPSNPEVLKNKPRKVKDFIITRAMGANIFAQASFFLVLLIGLMLYFRHDTGAMTPYELSFFFTGFVLLQFWNLFNARCLGSVRSAFNGIKHNPWFMVIAGLIIVLQICIVQFGGRVFRTVPLSFRDWMILLLFSSCVLWIGEIRRFFARLRQKKEIV